MATPQQWADAWSAGVTGAQTKYTEGIQNTTVDVVGRAVAQQAAMTAAFNAVVLSGEWARRIQAVGTTGWKAAAVAKAPNYATGASAGKPRYQNFAQQAQPYWTNLEAQVDSLPSGGKANALNRVSAWIDGMYAFKQQYTP